jgi:anti-sigma B factor antagonist
VEITTRQADGGLELVVSGRLDAYWSDHLSKALDEAVRGGTHHLRIDMAAVPYMSSVGIRVLLRFYKEAQRLGGSFAILRPSEAVRRRPRLPAR